MSAPSSISRRAFLRTASAAGALSLASTGCRNDNPGRDTLAKILVVGGGAAGLAVAAKLRRDLPRAIVLLAEPSARHACQPLLPLVALGLVPAGRIWRDTAGLVPAGVQWIPDAVSWVDVPRNEAVPQRGRASATTSSCWHPASSGTGTPSPASPGPRWASTASTPSTTARASRARRRP